jgi:hypothetical protein
MGQVIIGMDPHRRSATIEVIDEREKVLAQGRFATDTDGYQTMLKFGRRYRDRLWAVEGCNGIGGHIAQRLVADGETVVDVPSKLSARARVFATGQGAAGSTPTADSSDKPLPGSAEHPTPPPTPTLTSARTTIASPKPRRSRLTS